MKKLPKVLSILAVLFSAGSSFAAEKTGPDSYTEQNRFKVDFQPGGGDPISGAHPKPGGNSSVHSVEGIKHETDSKDHSGDDKGNTGSRLKPRHPESRLKPKHHDDPVENRLKPRHHEEDSALDRLKPKHPENHLKPKYPESSVESRLKPRHEPPGPPQNKIKLNQPPGPPNLGANGNIPPGSPNLGGSTHTGPGGGPH